MTVKPRWDVNDRACIDAYVEAAEACDFYSEVAAKLDTKFVPATPSSPKMTSDMLISSMRRGLLSASIGRFYPDKAEYIISKFRKDNKTRPKQKPAAPSRPAPSRLMRYTTPPQPPPEAKPPRAKQPDKAAAEQSAAIEKYLQPMVQRDIRRKLYKW